ncbi:Flp family type IVb pilin [Sphingosinicella soli]|uniref:Pilus assembly protein Flp/PilA n=1 Tax=Sphingosinicella soli TaxID=333708 RepID=A0A7W7B3H6_9SPHN|nr:Flp family type IVb pilin [Sphingosinicella soli]MBB4632433.1 pilus assembly protein Flp/PilA [Sphingosinicella soli]
MHTLRRLLASRTGATAIEYALIAALIPLAAIIAFQMLGLSLVNVFTDITTAMSP